MPLPYWLNRKKVTTMNTYYKVVTHIFGRRSTIIYEGAVKADERPKNTCEETWLVDIYEDFFDTEEEALQFVEDNRNFL